MLLETNINSCTIALQYKNGKLEKSISRNGTDAKNKIVKIQDIPKQLAISSIFQIRGELYAANRTAEIPQRITSRFF